jgi:hypothetical protein
LSGGHLALDPVRDESESRTPTERWAFAGAELGAARSVLTPNVAYLLTADAQRAFLFVVPQVITVERRRWSSAADRFLGRTGRFADATGSFTLESTVDQVTGISSGTFSGAIDH